MTDIKSFIKELFGAFKILTLKLICSRKALFHIVSKIFAGCLIFTLDHELYRVAVFTISSLFDLAYAGIITFESVKSNINVGVGR